VDAEDSVSSSSSADVDSPALPKPASTSPGRRRPTPRRASAPGAGLAFDVASAVLNAQMGDVDGSTPGWEEWSPARSPWRVSPSSPRKRFRCEF
jgi:hypothetical protein